MTPHPHRRVAVILGVSLAASALPALTRAQTMNANSASFNAGYGRTAGSENGPVDVRMGDVNGNMTVVNGLIRNAVGGSVFAGGGVSVMSSGVGSSSSASAIGNNLTVVTQGNYNTVIVNSTQTNNGTVTATTSTNGETLIDMSAPGACPPLSKRARVPAAVTACAMVLSACVSPVAGPSGRYAEPIGNAPVTANPTPYSEALVCLGEYARANRRNSPRIAVGRISDYTGKEESDGSGRKLTQGASLMAISALAKSGANLVERYDTSVSELELKYANNKLITDAAPPPPNAPPGPVDYRRIMAGQVTGSDYYLVGGITELNFNIRSSGLEAQGGRSSSPGIAAQASGQLFVMNVGLDLRLVDTRTLQIVDVISYQKQIVGRQVGVGVFDVLGGNVYNISAGEGGLEPIQLAVRSVIERAVLEMMSNLYGAPGPEVCLQHGDPLNALTTGVTGGYTPAYNNLDSNNAQTREDPARWDDAGDPPAVARGRDR